METVKFNPAAVLQSKNRFLKLVKICNLFTSKVEFEAGKRFFDIKAETDLIERLNFNDTGELHISGEDESQAAFLIKQCVSC